MSAGSEWIKLHQRTRTLTGGRPIWVRRSQVAAVEPSELVHKPRATWEDCQAHVWLALETMVGFSVLESVGTVLALAAGEEVEP